MCQCLVPINVTVTGISKGRSQNGFSLIELLLVVVIIGVIAAISVPNYIRARSSAENGSAISHMRTLASSQAAFYASRGRYGRLDELRLTTPALGEIVGPRLMRGAFTYEMSPLEPTDDEIKNVYTISGIKTVGADTQYDVKQSGVIEQIRP